MNKKAEFILDELNKLFPDADIELDFSNIHELAIAVMLSAQTTDKQVNVVTPALFAKYPTLEDYANADVADLEQLLNRIGLYKGKAKNVKGMAEMVLKDFGGEMPRTIDELVKLPGIGRKTANVIISVGFGIPGFAVDTHVDRISKRLDIVDQKDNVVVIEHKLKEFFPEETWNKLHHQMIFFGRYKCKARTPDCEDCPFQSFCRYYQGK